MLFLLPFMLFLCPNYCFGIHRIFRCFFDFSKIIKNASQVKILIISGYSGGFAKIQKRRASASQAGVDGSIPAYPHQESTRLLCKEGILDNSVGPSFNRREEKNSFRVEPE
jgi:hypothetical protein